MLSRTLRFATRRAVTTVTTASPMSTDASDGASKGWLKKMLGTSPGPGGAASGGERGSHAALLTQTEHIYEMHTHKVKPPHMEGYLKQFESFIKMINEKKTGAELVGSWTVEVGDQDEAIHLWRYTGGYGVLNKATELYRTDKDFVEFRKERNKMIYARHSNIMMKFTFWPDPTPRETKGIYEWRTYALKPGNLIEWGNLWARGIKFRTLNNEAVCGWFNQIGDLYTVHHLWSYKDLQSRKETREAAWRHPGWDENVTYTVPLVRHMTSRVLIPTPFSPLR